MPPTILERAEHSAMDCILTIGTRLWYRLHSVVLLPGGRSATRAEKAAWTSTLDFGDTEPQDPDILHLAWPTIMSHNAYQAHVDKTHRRVGNCSLSLARATSQQQPQLAAIPSGVSV